MRVGSTVSLLETATGRILAAFLPQATIRTALRDGLDRLSIGYDPEREIEGPAVDKTLDDIRSRGLARAVGDPCARQRLLGAGLRPQRRRRAGRHRHWRGRHVRRQLEQRHRESLDQLHEGHFPAAWLRRDFRKAAKRTLDPRLHHSA